MTNTRLHTLDYYPFGMQITERSETFTTNSYRYGFNGMENDNEVSENNGDYVLYTYRIQDTRLGRFLSVDPLSDKFPNLSSYQFASNSPIENIDIDGLEGGSTSMAATLGFTLTYHAKKPTITILAGASVAAKIKSISGEMGGKVNLALKNGNTPKYHFMAYASAGVGNTLNMKAYATTPTLNSQATTPGADFVPNVGSSDQITGSLVKDGFVGFGFKYDQGNMVNSSNGLSTNLTLATGPLTKTNEDNTLPGGPAINFDRKTTALAMGFAQNTNDGDKSSTFNLTRANTEFQSSGTRFNTQWSANTISTTSLSYSKFSIGKSSFKSISLYSNMNKAPVSVGVGIITSKSNGVSVSGGAQTGPTGKK